MMPEEYQGETVVAIYRSPNRKYNAHAHPPQDVIDAKQKAIESGHERVRTFDRVNEAFLAKVQEYIEHLDPDCPELFELSDILGED